MIQLFKLRFMVRTQSTNFLKYRPYKSIITFLSGLIIDSRNLRWKINLHICSLVSRMKFSTLVTIPHYNSLPLGINSQPQKTPTYCTNLLASISILIRILRYIIALHTAFLTGWEILVVSVALFYPLPFLSTSKTLNLPLSRNL